MHTSKGLRLASHEIQNFESESAYTHFYTNKLPYVAMEMLIMHA